MEYKKWGKGVTLGAAMLCFCGCANVSTVKPEGTSQCARKVIDKDLGMISCEESDGTRKWSRVMTDRELASMLTEKERKTVEKNRAEKKTKLEKTEKLDAGIAVVSVVTVSAVGLIYTASRHEQRKMMENIQKAGGWDAYARIQKKKYGE